ncbi:hypothetical protein [Nocardia sp. No.11]|uniref:hypothetical protein n=1 Tax=Nocardia sp. No.11 TaxID=3128861 RepID=UPI00319D9557
MASDRETLTNLLLDCQETAASPRETADFLIERGVRLPARKITTMEELLGLPRGVVVRSRHGSIGCRFDDDYGVVFGDDRPFAWTALGLPATVLFTPAEGGRR